MSRKCKKKTKKQKTCSARKQRKPDSLLAHSRVESNVMVTNNHMKRHVFFVVPKDPAKSIHIILEISLIAPLIIQIKWIF